LDAVIEIKNQKIHRKIDCSKFFKPVFFQTVARCKKRYISKIYGDGLQERSETTH